MSSAKHGMVALVDDAAKAAQSGLDEREAELRQLELEDPLTGEELLEAREALGFGAGALAIRAKARETRRGRPPGAKNKNTAELRNYLMQFGGDPLVGAVKLYSEDPLVLAELWRCPVKDVIDRQLRARELVSPYMHGKQPVRAIIGFAGVGDLIFEDGTDAPLAGEWSEVGEPLGAEADDTAAETGSEGTR